MPEYVFPILDTTFVLSTQDDHLQDYPRAFMEAYQASGDGPPTARTVRVRVTRGPIDPTAGGTTVGVHRSKHPYWTLDGQVLGESPRRVRWSSRGVLLTIGDGARNLDVVAAPETDAATVGEAVFHACRSLALYLRDATGGVLLHASAVEVGGAAVLFLGGVLAGKTTLMNEAVVRYGARPLANDRVWLRPGHPPIALSWPSYASYCEGTLLSFPPLAEAAQRYEQEPASYRTQSWPRPLRPTFAKDTKRVYPMRWFTDAVGTRFLRWAQMGALALVRLAPGEPAGEFIRLDLRDEHERARVSEALASQSFEAEEPSFLPWHGLALPGGAPSVTDLLENLAGNDIPVFSFATNPGDLHPLKELLRRVSDERIGT